MRPLKNKEMEGKGESKMIFGERENKKGESLGFETLSFTFFSGEEGGDPIPLSLTLLKNGGVLLSHCDAVPSAPLGLTSLFGMGRGGSPTL